MPRGQASGESGQAAVESALTLPLIVFLVLGTIQLFLIFQARILAQYAVFRATRAGSVTQGKCQRMRHAAIAALLPTFAKTRTPAELGTAFGNHKNNRFKASVDGGQTGEIVWLNRERPTPAEWMSASNASGEDSFFDDPDRPLQRLDVQMIYWYPLRMPYVNWVMTRMFLAHWGIEAYHNANPTMPVVKDANWTKEATANWNPEADVAGEFLNRVNAKQYVFPIQATYSMRMMTPALRSNFGGDKWCRSP